MSLVTSASDTVTQTISATGYVGVFITMTLESALIPIPSELIMTFAGYLAYQHKFELSLVILVGALGNLVGSWLSYELGRRRGRPWLARHGKYLLLSHHDLDTSTRWLKQWRLPVVFVSRFVPGVRTYVSFPAGVARIPRMQFLVLTFFGSLGWAALLASVGYILGPHWNKIASYLHGLDLLVAVVLFAGLIWYIRRHLRRAQ